MFSHARRTRIDPAANPFSLNSLGRQNGLLGRGQTGEGHVGQGDLHRARLVLRVDHELQEHHLGQIAAAQPAPRSGELGHVERHLAPAPKIEPYRLLLVEVIQRLLRLGPRSPQGGNQVVAAPVAPDAENHVRHAVGRSGRKVPCGPGKFERLKAALEHQVPTTIVDANLNLRVLLVTPGRQVAVLDIGRVDNGVQQQAFGID